MAGAAEGGSEPYHEAPPAAGDQHLSSSSTAWSGGASPEYAAARSSSGLRPNSGSQSPMRASLPPPIRPKEMQRRENYPAEKLPGIITGYKCKPYPSP
uniref:Uncharacterized protein n=1 Tax=Oryza glumipatula TaxID=40148 RepID=A0A0E0A4Y0_9ORYZ